MQKRKARMRDVAELAGVATMTVSRVLNNSAPVTDEMRRRVYRAIKQLQYIPNPVARSLRQAKSNSIGVILPNFYDPFFSACAHAVSLVARRHQYSVSVTISDESASIEFAEASLMLRNNVEGFVVIPAANGKSRLDGPDFRSTPIVSLDRPIRGNRFHSVLVENKDGAACAVEHLLGHGHRRISHLGLSEHLYTIKSRYTGYCKAMVKAGLNPDKPTNCLTQEETTQVVREAMARRGPPTAFFVSNNLVMRFALHAFAELRIQVPGDVALVGFDDFEMADLMVPALTVVRQPIQEMGRVAAERLFSILVEKKVSTSAARRIVLPVELIVRRSCGCNPRQP